MSTDNIAYHPAFGNPPVVNTVRVNNDSRKRKVTRLTKARRLALRLCREQREREEQAKRDEGPPGMALITRLIRLVPAPLSLVSQVECDILEKTFAAAVAKVIDDRGPKPAA